MTFSAQKINNSWLFSDWSEAFQVMDEQNKKYSQIRNSMIINSGSNRQYGIEFISDGIVDMVPSYHTDFVAAEPMVKS